MSNKATVKKITDDQFWDLYEPVKNHFEEAAMSGCMFETYGEQFEFVIKQDPKYVWTIVEDDNGDLVYMNGFHVVNRFGYFVCANPSDLDVSFEVYSD